MLYSCPMPTNEYFQVWVDLLFKIKSISRLSL